MRLRRVCHAEARLAQPGSPKPWTTKFVVSSCIMSTNAPYQPAPEGQQGTPAAQAWLASPRPALTWRPRRKCRWMQCSTTHRPLWRLAATSWRVRRRPHSYQGGAQTHPNLPRVRPLPLQGQPTLGEQAQTATRDAKEMARHDLSGLAMLAAPHWLNQSMMAGSKRASITNKETANKMGGSKESGDDERRLMSQWVTADGCCAARQPPRRFVGWCRRPS